jgi:hypothetical protein
MTLAQLRISMLWKEGHLNEDEADLANNTVSFIECGSFDSKSADFEFSLKDRDFDFVDENNENACVLDLSSFGLEVPRINDYHALDTSKIDQQSQYTVVAIEDYKLMHGIHSFEAKWKDGRYVAFP